MYRSKLLWVFLWVLPFSISAQYDWSVGGYLGASSYLGSVGGGSTPAKAFIYDVNFPSTRFGLGGFVNYKLNPRFSFEAILAMDRISASDNQSSYLPRELRNLSFRDDIYNLDLLAQIYVFEIPGLVQNFKLNIDLRCYVTGGVNFFHFNPEGQYDGQWYSLEPLHTEGVSYSLWGVGIPMGFGSYVSVNRKHRIGLELLWTKTFTDDLDDNGNDSHNPGRYVDPSTLSSPAAVALANPSNEIVSKFEGNAAAEKLLSYNYQPGGLRSAVKGKDDSWFTYSVTYAYAIRGKSSFYRSKYPGLFGKSMKKRKIRAKF